MESQLKGPEVIQRNSEETSSKIPNVPRLNIFGKMKKSGKISAPTDKIVEDKTKEVIKRKSEEPGFLRNILTNNKKLQDKKIDNANVEIHVEPSNITQYYENTELSVNEDELSDILNSSYLEKIKKNGPIKDRTSSEESENDGMMDDDIEEDEDFFLDPYTRQMKKQEELNAKKGKPAAKGTSLNLGNVILPLNLPLPARPNSDRRTSNDITGVGKWSAPDSWSVNTTSEVQSKVVNNIDNRAVKGDEMSSIRVFKRDGTFTTLAAPISSSCSDLLAILRRKFFIHGEPPERAALNRLWVLRKGQETLILNNERPLRLQQQWLWEVGYDPENDRFQDILREDNSFLYRWIYSEYGKFSQTYNNFLESFKKDEVSFFSEEIKTGSDRRIAELVKMTVRDKLSSSHIHLNGCNLEAIPVVMFKNAKNIHSLDLSRNFALELPIDFAQLCLSLTSLKLSHVQMQRIPLSIVSILGLEVLDLSHNLITTLKDSQLNALTKLKDLNLSNNRLIGKNAVPIEITSSWRVLEKLNLSCNWLKGELPRAILMIGTDENRLLELDLSYNYLSSIPSDFSFKLRSLKKLWLVANNLSKVPENVLQGSENIEIFDIRGNHIRGSIAFGSSQGTKTRNMTKLLVDNNQISDIKLMDSAPDLVSIISHRNPGLLQIFFGNVLTNLTTLVASFSKLAFLQDEIFQYTPSLKVLILNFNQITSLPLSITLLKQLTRFEIAHNSLNKLPNGIKELSCLEIFDLHGNNIKELPSEIWDLPVRFLNLSSNIIESWPENPYINLANVRSSGMSFLKKNKRNGPNDFPSKDEEINQINDLPLVAPLASSLTYLSVADNRIETLFFENLTLHLKNLKSLNVSHNEIFSIPTGVLRSCAPTLEELYLSGNHITQLPDDIYIFTKLKRLYLNSNRIGSIPPELAKIANLRVLDLGRNQLRYNVTNWPYDWNWNFNQELKYLNLSGNPKLKISSNVVGVSNVAALSRKQKMPENTGEKDDRMDLSRFDSLLKLRVLSLMQVAVCTTIPDETNTKRVRVSAAGGASANWKKLMDLPTDSVPVANRQEEKLQSNITSTAPLIDAELLNANPVVSFGISDDLGEHEKSNAWDLVILGLKAVQNAKDDTSLTKKVEMASNAKPTESDLQKVEKPECIFGLFDSTEQGSSWTSKSINDVFVGRFSSELKKLFKERSDKAEKNKDKEDIDGGLGNASDNVLIQNAIRRSFLFINKHLGSQAFAATEKLKEKDEKKIEVSNLTSPSMSDIPNRRKQSSAFESPIYGRYKSIKKSDEFKRKKKESTKNSFPEVPEESDNISKKEVRKGMDFFYDEDSDSGEEDVNENYNKLQKNGSQGLIVYLVNGYMHVANCGDIMAVLSRNGKAVPLSMKHSLQYYSSHHKPKAVEELESTKDERGRVKSNSNLGNLSAKETKQSTLGKEVVGETTIATYMARQELTRIRQSGGFIDHDGLVSSTTIHTRSFGYIHLLPQINASPYMSLTEVNDQDEFLIIGSAAFWRSMNYQTAVDVAKLKADDALEAAMVLRDIAKAYSSQAVYSVDEDSENLEEKYRLKLKGRRDEDKQSLNPLRYRRHDAITVMVVNIKDWIGGKPKKIFTKMKRRKDEVNDSAIARLAPEVEPPVGLLTLVFTDVRNSTHNWEKRPLAMRVAIREHNALMRRNLRACNGYEVKTEGDAFIVSFKNVLDALKWCLTVQQQLLEVDWPQEILDSPDGKDVFGPRNSNDQNDPNDVLLYRGLAVRMGVHCGTPVCELDPITRRMDYFGPMVNKTARIGGHGEGGQILVSQDVEKAYRKLNLGTVMKDGQTEEGSQNCRTSSTNDKLTNLIQLDPVFINIGEKKLKGIENTEILFAVFPKSLMARHKIPPPPLELQPEGIMQDEEKMNEIPSSPRDVSCAYTKTSESMRFDMVEQDINFPRSELSSPESFKTFLMTQNNQVSRNEDNDVLRSNLNIIGSICKRLEDNAVDAVISLLNANGKHFKKGNIKKDTVDVKSICSANGDIDFQALNSFVERIEYAASALTVLCNHENIRIAIGDPPTQEALDVLSLLVRRWI